MRFICFVGTFVLAASFGPQTQAATVFSATLNESQASAGAGTGSSATGIANLTLNDAQTRLEMTLTINGIDFVDQGGTDTGANDATIFHIHRAPAGQNGPVVFGLIGPNNDTNGDLVITPFNGGATVFSAWDSTEGLNTTLTEELDNLVNEGLYFNLHTTGFAGGEIRGQISLVPEPSALMVMASMSAFTLLRRRRRAA